MFKKILVAVDINRIDDAKKVVKAALHFGGNDAVYRVITVIPPFNSSFVQSFLPVNFDKDVLREANKALHDFTQETFPEGAKVQHIVANGPIYEEIVKAADDKKVDVIVINAIKKNRVGLSSTSVKVARMTHKTVIFVR